MNRSKQERNKGVESISKGAVLMINFRIEARQRLHGDT